MIRKTLVTFLIIFGCCSFGVCGYAETDSTEALPFDRENTDRGNGSKPDADRGIMGQRNNQGGGNKESVSHYSEAEALFEQFEFYDEETQATIPYNLYLPEGYDESKTYPLVVYIADRGVNSNEVTDVLHEDGATVWATESEQAKHECIVLAPQYTLELENSIGALMEDDYEWSNGLTLVSNLIFQIIDEYSVDENRIYGTGQS